MERREATALLKEAATGETAAADRLVPDVYSDLRRLAERHLRSEREGHTLQATALVHEVYLRLIDQDEVDASDRERFFALAARLIRRVLIDHARARGRLKRGGDRRRVQLTVDREVAPEPEERNVDLLYLEDAMEKLAELDPRQCRVVELRFFGGLTIDEVAHTLDVSARTVALDWRHARAWLRDRIASTAS